eukprot:COSAG03_NODE_858_length_5603_cov_3.620276_9_plen_105_part_00
MNQVECGRNAVWGGCEACLINSHFQISDQSSYQVLLPPRACTRHEAAAASRARAAAPPARAAVSSSTETESIASHPRARGPPSTGALELARAAWRGSAPAHRRP